MHGQREEGRDLKWSDRTNGVWREPSEPPKNSADFWPDSILILETRMQSRVELPPDTPKPKP
jgi:hypothetical protein